MKKNNTTTKILTAAVAVMLLLSGCAGNAANTATSEKTKSGKQWKIGISQTIEHPALDASLEGFKRAFEESGFVEGTDVVFDVKNAQGEATNASTIATGLKDKKMDLVLAIGTPTAQAAASVLTETPVVFTAVTDPVVAGLVDTLDVPGGNVTGTTDMNPVAEQIALISEVLPGASTLGIIYSSGEINSKIQVDIAKKAAAEVGLSVKEATVTNSSEIAQATNSLSGVDAIYVPTDNNVVAGLGSVVQFAETEKIALFAAETNSVTEGAIATYGMNYSDLGYQTGMMAIKILQEEATPAELPVGSADLLELVVNEGAAERMGVKLPESLLKRADKRI